MYPALNHTIYHWHRGLTVNFELSRTGLGARFEIMLRSVHRNRMISLFPFLYV